jgi:hypothetical protein
MRATGYYRGRTVVFMKKNSKKHSPGHFGALLGAVRWPPWGCCWRVAAAAEHASQVGTDYIFIENTSFWSTLDVPADGDGQSVRGWLSIQI